jgi:centrosomal protein CEP104
LYYSRFVELSSNDKTQHKARELKSVYVDGEGTFLKLILHKNYVNKYNLSNQISLIAINVIGSEIAEYIRNNEMDKSGKKSDFISPLDDLAFAMYQDPEVSQIIKALDRKKNQHVSSNELN